MQQCTYSVFKTLFVSAFDRTYCFIVCNVMYPVMHKQHLLNVNHLTSDKLINSGIIPSTKHPTNIAREMRITPQAPSMLASVNQPFPLNLLTHIQAVSRVT